MSRPAGYRREARDGHPPYALAAYASTKMRAPLHDLVYLEHTVSEITGPRLGSEIIGPGDTDMSRFNGGSALGERIIVTGHVLDEDEHPVPNTLIELWQANAAGRYAHDVDQHDAPLDPHFAGLGRVLTDDSGVYRFMSIKPGAYPWRNDYNSWRPQHIHYSLFGPGFATRLVTQMYFPGDPLLARDPIFNCIPDDAARQRLICAFDIDATVPEQALGYRFDIVLRGRNATPMEV